MGKIVISGPQNVSLDGVVQDPDGKEGFRLGGWFGQFGGKNLEEWNKVALDEALRTQAWLLGRRSYEFFGARWRPRSGELADRLNSMPKYVVSSTLEEPDWDNTVILKGDVVTEVSKLKQELDGEIVVPASYQLGRTLIDHDLADELRLVVFPVVLGAGERLFGETSAMKPMRLVDTKTIGDGLAFLTYQFDRGGRLSTYPQPARQQLYRALTCVFAQQSSHVYTHVVILAGQEAAGEDEPREKTSDIALPTLLRRWAGGDSHALRLLARRSRPCVRSTRPGPMSDQP
jgi:dihydrofolate reductase